MFANTTKRSKDILIRQNDKKDFDVALVVADILVVWRVVNPLSTRNHDI